MWVCIYNSNYGPFSCFHGNTEPPFITRALVDTLVVQLGSYIIFPCEATSYQDTPTIHWSFNGLPLVPSPRWKVLSDQSLLLTAINLNDTGTYSCMASNQYGTSVANVTVWVLSKLSLSPWLPLVLFYFCIRVQGFQLMPPQRLLLAAVFSWRVT